MCVRAIKATKRPRCAIEERITVGCQQLPGKIRGLPKIPLDKHIKDLVNVVGRNRLTLLCRIAKESDPRLSASAAAPC